MDDACGSTVGVPGAIAPGIGSPSILARSNVVSVRLPPAEVPKMPMLPARVVPSNAR